MSLVDNGAILRMGTVDQEHSRELKTTFQRKDNNTCVAEDRTARNEGR